jgi:periplasmic protein TonB
MKRSLKFLQFCAVAGLLLIVSLSAETAKPAVGQKAESGNTLGREIKDLTEEKDLDAPLALVSGRLPQYPGELRKAGPAGYVVVEFIINRSGDVIQTQVLESSRREFELPALQSVQTWKFKPGKKDKHAVNVRSIQRLEFEPPKK